MADERFDSMLLGMAQTLGGIEPILHNFLSFLARRTDFFHIQDENNKHTGFPPGVAEQMLLKHFKHFEGLALQQKQVQDAAREQKQAKEAASEAPDEPDTKPAPVDVTDVPPAPAPAPAPPEDRPVTATNPEKPVTLYETTVEVPVPEGIRSKDICVNITKTKLQVGLKGKQLIIDGELGGKIVTDECTWLKEGSVVQVTLVKEIETWWKSVVVGDPEIDTTKVDSVRHVSEYDEETQAGIQKVMFDQEQKRKGLPTSDELQQQDLLKKAWDAEGSPFKGQPFDPSVLNMSGGLPPGFDPSQMQ